jgi:hypothetical protein
VPAPPHLPRVGRLPCGDDEFFFCCAVIMPPNAQLLPLFAWCAASAEAWVASAQTWPTNESGLWRPEAISLQGGAMSALWEMPDRLGDTHGLGGGISYAWDPQLCGNFVDRCFDEDVYFISFLSCDSLRAAMARAFATWEVQPAHPRCDASPPLVVPMPTPICRSAPAVNTRLAHSSLTHTLARVGQSPAHPLHRRHRRVQRNLRLAD